MTPSLPSEGYQVLWHNPVDCHPLDLGCLASNSWRFSKYNRV